ncbi:MULTISPECIES: hypothetical protein [unclassified Streptomyces]|uniref:hypothetical protein n=1 Tax=unclassified Streptomyces TaxID=2593676 RepID=UPI002E2AB439|nr:hypothetical protein [Streptomyces sp. NBC_00223]
MTISGAQTSASAEARASAGPVALLRGFVVSGMVGAALAGVVVGSVIKELRPALIGAGLAVLVVVFVVVLNSWRRARLPEPQRLTALAVIESRRAGGSETGDIPVQFELTVAPEGGPAFRSEARMDINLVDIPDYPPGRMLVVTYRVDRPWKVKIVDRPSPEWARRVAEESVDSAPESAKVESPPMGGGLCLLTVLGLLVGGALVVLLYRGDLFKDDVPAKSSASPTVSSSTSSTSTSFTVTGTGFTSSATVSGSGEPLLREGEMRRTSESLISATGTPDVLELTIGARTMTLRGGIPLTLGPDPLIDVRAIPYERLPALIHQARTTLGVKAPTSWRLTVGKDAKSGKTVIRVSVKDDHGSVSLEADAGAHVTARHPR